MVISLILSIKVLKSKMGIVVSDTHHSLTVQSTLNNGWVFDNILTAWFGQWII